MAMSNGSNEARRRRDEERQQAEDWRREQDRRDDERRDDRRRADDRRRQDERRAADQRHRDQERNEGAPFRNYDRLMRAFDEWERNEGRRAAERARAPEPGNTGAEDQGTNPRPTPREIFTHWHQAGDRHVADPRAKYDWPESLVNEVIPEGDGIRARFNDGAEVVDDGRQIRLVKGVMTESKADIMADVAARHGWTSVRLTGTRAEIEMLARAAIRRGLDVSNPELQRDLPRWREEEAQREATRKPWPQDATQQRQRIEMLERQERTRQADEPTKQRKRTPTQTLAGKVREQVSVLRSTDQGRSVPDFMAALQQYKEAQRPFSGATAAEREAAKVNLLAHAHVIIHDKASWRENVNDPAISKDIDKWAGEVSEVFDREREAADAGREAS